MTISHDIQCILYILDCFKKFENGESQGAQAVLGRFMFD